MTRNIFLTSLDALENDRTLRYYAAKNAYGYDYCEAMQSTEASTKVILSRFPIDDIIVVGEEASSDYGKPLPLKDAGALYSADPGTLTAFELYRSRIAQFIGEESLEQRACDALLPEETRTKLVDFIRGFQAQFPDREEKRLNRLFDGLARSQAFYEQFRSALFAAFPEARDDSRLILKWVKNYLYEQLKPTAKLEILPVNENISARFVPANLLENREYWFSDVLDVNQEVLDGEDEINLFISMADKGAMETHLVLNMLNILIATPGSNIHLKKIFSVTEPTRTLTGIVDDDSEVSLSTDLVVAAHAFLNYSKTDMLVDFWRNYGKHDDRISYLLYAARHVDMGVSMCNITEMQEGINALRQLFRDDRSWTELGEYGLLFGLIAGCIQADYRAMLEGDGNIPFIELIKWAYRHQLYQQTLTLIEAHAPSNLVNTGIFYYCDDEAGAEEVTNLLAAQRLELKPYEYYKMDDISHYFIKNYDRGSVRLSDSQTGDRNLAYAAMRVQSLKKPDPAKISGHTACDSTDTVRNVLYAYYHLGVVRNKVSHADDKAMSDQRPGASESGVSPAMQMMKESIEFFIMSYEAALEEVKGKNPKIVAISPDAVRNAADRMRRGRNQEDRRPPFRNKD